jgi:SAM-dependent methyltransferase
MSPPVAINPSWGGLRRLEPISRKFGLDLGTAIDRHYIERFLATNQSDIHGRVLEIGEPTYTRKFGSDRVTRSDVLHAVAGNKRATLVGDLVTGSGIPRDAFDCIILTQVLPYIFDVRSAIATCRQALAPGGAVLATVNSISPVSRYDMDRWGDFWRFTDLSARMLFEQSFGAGHVAVQAFGNALVATAFIQGIPLEELTPEELAAQDPDYPVSISIRAVRTP